MLLTLLTLLCPPAHAHGAIPQSMAIVFESDDDALPLVSTSFGVLAPRSAHNWVWICEDLTGQTYGTLFQALPDGTWLFGATTGLWRSEDRCDWGTVADLDGHLISDLKRDRTDAARVWVTTATPDRDNGLWRSDDHGQTFSLVVGPDVLGAGATVRGYADAPDGTVALVGRRDDAAMVWWSTDGAAWTEHLVPDVPEDSSVLALELDASDSGVLWLRYNGVSEDQLVRFGSDGAATVVLDLADDLAGFVSGPEAGALEVGSRILGLYRSADGGGTWSQPDDPSEVGCFTDHQGQRYLCANNWVDGGAVIAGPAGATAWDGVLDFGDVHGPEDCPAGTAAADVCDPLWDATRTFAGLDLNEIPDTGTLDTGSPAKQDCGCAATPTRGALMLLIPAALAALRRRAGLSLLLLVACTAEPVEPPSVAFLAPLDGDTVCGDPLTGELALSGFELTVEATADTSVPDGIGHGHLYLNGQEAGDAYAPEWNIPGPIDAGAYQFKVELANLNHSPVEPYVFDLIYITIDNTICGES